MSDSNLLTSHRALSSSSLSAFGSSDMIFDSSSPFGGEGWGWDGGRESRAEDRGTEEEEGAEDEDGTEILDF